MVTRSDDLRPISIAVAIRFDRDPKGRGAIMAFSGLASLPVMPVVLRFQRPFIRSAMSPASKG